MRAWLERYPALGALLAGIAVATALPPVHFLPGLLGFGALMAVLRRHARQPSRAFRHGTLFGFGFFLVGLYWVGIAFFADAERFGPFAVPAVLLLAFGLGLTVGAGAALTAAWRWRRVASQALVFAAWWAVAETLRGGLGLQFPWNPVASVWAVSDATLQPLAWVGTYPLSLITVAAAGASAPWFLRRPGGARALLLPLAWAAALVVAGLARLASAPALPPTGVEVRIVQASVQQGLKWDPAQRPIWFRRHLELSTRPRATPADIVVWPESAVPYQIEREPEVRSLLGDAAPPGGALLVGGDRYDLEPEPPVATNSLFVLDPAGTVRGRYDKVDLVPFGEFLPFRAVLGRLGLGKLTEGSIDFVPGPGRTTLTLPGLPPASPLICYEAAFPGRATGPGPRPQWLVNITNDAWFGVSSGPFQHLAMARMRAVEEGLPLVRAANTGISAVADSFGRVVAALGLNEVGVLDAVLPPALTEPPAVHRYAQWLLPSLLVAIVFVSLMVEISGRDSRENLSAPPE